MSDETQYIVIDTVDFTIVSLAELGRAQRDAVEHWFEVRWRAGNHTEDLAGRRLLFQRLSHLSMGLGECLILFLQFSEQPHVLDGDNGLVGEGLEQCDLVVGEWPGLRAAHGDDSDGLTLAHHGYDEVAAKADCTAQLSKGVLRIELDVRYVDDGAVEDRPARPRCPARRSRPGRTCRLPRGRRPGGGSGHVQEP